MLVLSRKLGEEILIGDSIKLVISRINGNRVTIGIAAPHNVHIKRGELVPMTRQPAKGKPHETLVAAM